MHIDLTAASLKALDFQARSSGLDGSVSLEDSEIGPNQSTIYYHGTLGDKVCRRFWSISNAFGNINVDQAAVGSLTVLSWVHRGQKGSASAQKRFANFTAALAEDAHDIARSQLLSSFPTIPVAGLKNSEKELVAEEFADLQFPGSFRARFGPILGHLARKAVAARRKDADTKKKLEDTKRRRAEFKSLPAGAGFSIAGMPHVFALKSGDDLKWVQLRRADGRAMERLTPTLLRRLTLLVHADLREAPGLTGHEKMVVIEITESMKAECPLLRAGPPK